MTTSIITPEIASFAEAVRDALHDLPADERDELTDGLEADLAEAYAEDVKRELPDPVEYATELRNAAGLPKVEQIDAGMFATLGASMRRARTDLTASIRDNSALEPVLDFLIAIRPLWWVARAWVAAWLVAGFFGSGAGVLPTSLSMSIVLIGFVVVSIQWGRGRWGSGRLAPLIVLGNVIAIVLLPFVATLAASWNEPIDYYDGAAVEPSVGLTSGGESVTNIFAYGADGKPLSNVQLFDQDGHPLVVQRDPMFDECADFGCSADVEGMAAAEATLETGAVVGNVFPLSLVATRYDPNTDQQVIDPTATPQPQKPPFIKLPAVLTAPDKGQKVAPSNE